MDSLKFVLLPYLRRAMVVGGFIILAYLISLSSTQAHSNQKIPYKLPLSISNLPKTLSKNIPSPAEQKGLVDGEILVKFKSAKINLKHPLGFAMMQVFALSKSLLPKTIIDKQNLTLFRIADDKTIGEKIAELKVNPQVEYAQPNYRYAPFWSPNDTYMTSLWGLYNYGQTVNSTSGTADADIDATEAWDAESSTWTDAKVAVIDTGTLPYHPDLSSNFSADSYDFTDDDNLPIDDLDLLGGGHGTHVMGTVAAIANNSKGTSGVSVKNNIKVMFLKTDYTTAEMVEAINYADTNGAKAINASWGCTYPLRAGGTQMVCGSTPGYDYSDAALNTAISDFDGLFVVAAGNGNGDSDAAGDNHNDPAEYHTYPCDLSASNILCVAATTQNDALTSFSDYGTSYVDVAAPGKNILSSYPQQTTTFQDTFSGVANGSISSNFTREGTPNYFGVLDSLGDKYLLADYDNWGWGYANNSNYSVYSKSFNLSSSNIYASYVIFYISCDTELSDPAGTSDYLSVKAYNGSTWTELQRYNEFNIGDALLHLYGVDTSAYENSNFRFKFTWVTDAADNSYYGCYIYQPTLLTWDYTTAYDYSDGTSMAAPHVTGLAGLIWSYRPSLTAAQLKSIIMTTGDTKSGLTSKIATGKRVNAQKALQYFDSTAPTGSININSNSTYAKSHSVTLALSALDNAGGFGIYQMRFSNNNSSWSSWYSYTTSGSWSLANGAGGSSTQGTRKVYVQYKDKIGNTVTKYDSIIYDKTAPSGSLRIYERSSKSYKKSAVTYSRVVTLRSRGSDSLSGVSKMRLSNNGKKWSSWRTYKKKLKWNITSSKYGGSSRKGIKNVYIKFKDKAGNISRKIRVRIRYR